MVSNDKNIGSLSVEIKPGDHIMLGNAIRLVIVENKKTGAVRLRVIAPRAVLINYKPKRVLRGE